MRIIREGESRGPRVEMRGERPRANPMETSITAKPRAAASPKRTQIFTTPSQPNETPSHGGPSFVMLTFFASCASKQRAGRTFTRQLAGHLI